MMKNWLTLFLLSFLFVGCSSSIQTNNIQNDSVAEEILQRGSSSMQDDATYMVLHSGQYPRESEDIKETKVFHSDDSTALVEFREMYTAMTGDEAPIVDGTVIIAKMGIQNTGGYSIELESVKDSGRYMDVILSYNAPTSQLVTMALTNPYIIIYLPNNHKEINVIEE